MTTPSSLPKPGNSPDPVSSERQFNVRLGMILFVIYLALYLGFVLINAFKADWMEMTAVAGLNLAIVYGFGLIVAALVLALIYGWFCRVEAIEPESMPAEGDEA